MISNKASKRIRQQLRELGFISYNDFLNSDLWSSFRKQMYIVRKPTCCGICARGNCRLNLHHQGYKHLLSPDYVVFVCDKCHELIHEDIDLINHDTNKNNVGVDELDWGYIYRSLKTIGGMYTYKTYDYFIKSWLIKKSRGKRFEKMIYRTLSRQRRGEIIYIHPKLDKLAREVYESYSAVKK